jgi:hypothetical protein
MSQHLPANSPAIEQSAGHSRLLSRLYREIGLAAVAAELKLQASALEPEIAEVIERGASMLVPQRNTLAA